ncbi:MAG: chromosomal replication initiator protein DnaA [Solirubrobacteraceae bacterium]
MPAVTDDIWNRIRGELRRAVPTGAYDHWLRTLEPRELGERQLVLAAPDHAARWVADRFGRVLQASAAAVLGPEVEVEIVACTQTSSDAAGGRAAELEHEPSPEYTFDRFVIGEGNRLAHAAALAVAELPGHAYNPLFISGPPGVGKTHLLHSIASYVRTYGEAAVRCVTADGFTTGFVRALQTGAVDRFKACYRNADVLLIDDVQFLQDKTRTEEEVFHTFNTLYESGRQLVFTSDRPPAEIAAVEERLRERFQSGLVAGIAAPDFETRLTILRNWARQAEWSDLTDEVVELVASRVTGNVRALQGALTHVVASASLYRRPLGGTLVAEALDGFGPAADRPVPSVREVQELVAEEFGLTVAQLTSSSRSGNVAWPRQLAMYLSREHADATLPAIGREFGGRDHTTVLYACRRARQRLARDTSLAAAAHALADQLWAPPGDRAA